MNRAKQLRIDRGLTVSAVAESTGVSRLAVARAEDPTCNPTAPTLKALGDYYGVPASSLLLPAVEDQSAA